MDPEPLFSLIQLNIIIIPLTSGIYWGIAGILILLISSALVSGSEVAFFSLSPSQKNLLLETDSKKNNLILSLTKKPEKLLATILIANNFINVGIVMLSAYVINSAVDFSNTPDWLVFLIQIVTITFLLLLFGEIIPKVYATEASLKFAKFTVYPLSLSMKLFMPVSNLLIKSTSFVNKRLKMKQNISVEDLSDALELTEADIKQDKGILERIVTFGSIDVKEIMKPRVDVVAADINFSYNKLKSLIIESGFSRIPVYEENHDNIKGILLIKDLLRNIDVENYKWQQHIKTPFFVPETMKINDLLEDFRQKKIHISIVTDEYGGFLGIATMEDIIEEIVGEISDEKDIEEKNFQKIDDKNYIFDGKIQLNDFYKVLEIKEDIFEKVRGEADSLAGLILEKQGEIPKKGEVIKIDKYTFTIDSADNRKIKKIKLKIND
ncbi:MAG: gliding motility-associated protein GldE [Bacteroidales bacterium]|nr:gliding motility-associated protein GldE [Bacteroidales bacterium]